MPPAEAEARRDSAADSHRALSANIRGQILEQLRLAEPRLAGELEAARGKYGALHVETHARTCELAAVLLALGRPEDSGVLIEEALAEWQQAFPQGGPEIAALELALERCHQAQD